MPVVFVDFDGTITVRETFADMLKHFSPELAADLIPRMLDEELPLRIGVRALLESIDSARFPDILRFVDDAEIRPGFEELLEDLDARGVPLVVVSGGLTAIVERVLGPLTSRLHGLHAVELDLSGPRLRPHTPFEGGDELLAKVRVMERYPSDEVVAIGDSLTDLKLAERADLVFARGRLQRYLDERDVDYVPWTDFHDVRVYLSRHWSST